MQSLSAVTIQNPKVRRPAPGTIGVIRPRGRVRVMLVVSSLEHAGAERQVVALANHLDRDLFEMHVCSLSEHVPLAVGLGQHTTLHVVQKRSRFDTSVISRLAALLKRLRIDVVHTFLFDAEIAGRLAARLAHVKVCIGSERNTDYVRPRLHTLALRLTRSFCDGLVANSRSGKRFNIRTLGLPDSHIHVVYNGVDTNVFRPRTVDALRGELGIADGDRVVAMVAHFKRQKNHGMFFEVATRVLESEPNTWFLCVGEPLRDGLQGSNEYHQQMSQLVDSLGIRSRFKFLGTRSDVADIYNICDVVVLTSRREGTPNVLLEAMASGVPVVATDVADNAVHVPNGHTGYIVPLDDVEQMAEHLLCLLSDQDARNEMGHRAEAWVHQRYALGEMSGAMAAVYRHLLVRKRVFARQILQTGEKGVLPS